MERAEGTLLIVETGTAFGQTLSERLEQEPYRILFATREKEAKRILRKQGVDVVILALASLKKDGLRLLGAIKKARPLTEVILINTWEHLWMSIEGMKLGAFDDFLVPFDLEAMVRRIQEACSRKRLRESRAGQAVRGVRQSMAAAAFAEAGEPGMALEMLERRRKNRKEEP